MKDLVKCTEMYPEKLREDDLAEFCMFWILIIVLLVLCCDACKEFFLETLELFLVVAQLFFAVYAHEAGICLLHEAFRMKSHSYFPVNEKCK